MYTKKELAEGIGKFINNDLIPSVDNERLRFVLCICKKAMYENPDMLDAFFESPLIASVTKNGEDEDMYDISVLAKSMKSVLSEYESYPIVIPKIPVFAPDRNVVRITSADIDKIIAYMSPEETVS
jgi:hypothetical protein